METTKWDMDEELNTDEDIIEYLRVVFADGDAFDVRMAVANVVSALRARNAAKEGTP